MVINDQFIQRGLESKLLTTDILVVGGGTAGCYAALTIAENSSAEVIVAEKANIERSGCLAAGVNALNAYIVKGQSPESYLNYVKNDSEDVIREDLVFTIAQGLNRVTQKLESLGLVIQKDSQGEYVARGTRNIKINGENIKPLLAQAVRGHSQVEIYNGLNIIDYIVEKGEVVGAYGFSLKSNLLYVIAAKAVICTTGGAAGLYRPNNPGFSKHKMWYPPFNTGSGYAMGIRAGAEMTTFEMRFIALRCKDTIAPTGTIAQGVSAPQINSLGEEYDYKYGPPKTHLRVYSTVMENKAGRGPCYLKTVGISKEQEVELYKAYLNMAPAQTLKWLENGQGPSEENVEIEGTEPYIVGGHTGSGYWVNGARATTLAGLYAAGDVAGGSPQKYVTGCLVEGEIAALASLKHIEGKSFKALNNETIKEKLEEVNKFFTNQGNLYRVEDLEEAMQKNMDQYAGGISNNYAYNAKQLEVAARRTDELLELTRKLRAEDSQQLLRIYELLDRLYVCKVLIRHLAERKETRWHSFQENSDYPEKNDQEWLKYVNSVYKDGEIKIIRRDLVKKDDVYEH